MRGRLAGSAVRDRVGETKRCVAQAHRGVGERGQPSGPEAIGRGPVRPALAPDCRGVWRGPRLGPDTGRSCPAKRGLWRSSQGRRGDCSSRTGRLQHGGRPSLREHQSGHPEHAFHNPRHFGLPLRLDKRTTSGRNQVTAPPCRFRPSGPVADLRPAVRTSSAVGSQS